LVEHALARHYPTVDRQGSAALALLDAVTAAQAELVARWLGVGFIHGVMNTDNMTISGETIDYGPCAFMDEFNPDTVFSSIDRNGRYAFAEQPKIAQWNLIRLAESLLALIDSDETAAIEQAQASVSRFASLFSAAWRRIALAKIGIAAHRDDDMALVQDLLETMHREGLDFTNTFRSLVALVELTDRGGIPGDWAQRWRERIENEPGGAQAARVLMLAANPQVIARNHQVEHALATAATGDHAPFQRLVAALADPYGERADRAWLMMPPAAHERVEATFCGT
ncbi:MAG: protein adenylyltransferase SelO family protein, partial [Rhizobiaceae bacterium]